jgi:flavodoxin
MHIKLNYFTSTGNTLWVAEKVRAFWKAKEHEVDLYDSVTCGMNAVEACDLIGFVYPVWGSTLPNPRR